MERYGRGRGVVREYGRRGREWGGFGILLVEFQNFCWLPYSCPLQQTTL
jgi:hypothetical protein